MEDSSHRAIAIVGVSAILPDAPNALQFWHNIKNRHYSISEVPAGRWDPACYYDPDPRAPDKTYSKIGGWVQDWQWDPFAWHLPIPPKVATAMDDAQKWAVALAHAVLLDYGDSERPLDRERTAVILGNAMGGELHYMTSLRIYFPEYARALSQAASFSSLPPEVQRAIEQQMQERMAATMPLATEDTMPGELSNCMAGRVANLFDFKGPNYVCDAACASALAALDAACEGLVGHEYDAALVGGIDRNMGAPTYVKFCKIGALSATGTRPYADGADGFVMGEGAAFFLLKRLADAERNGDRIYAVLRGIGGSSDGRGKGITAPNPVGQQLALQRAWHNAGLSPSSVGLIEGHGTSTKVGDVVEVNSLIKIFGSNGLAPGSVALGSVKSNIGHLKSGAGAAGLLKAMYSLHHQVLPPSLNFKKANPNIDFGKSPFYVNTELRPWQKPNNADGVRRAGVSAFGFGGTNFHVVLEEYVPGRLSARKPVISAASQRPQIAVTNARSVKPPLQGSLVLGAASVAQLRQRLDHVLQSRQFPEMGTAPAASDLAASERLVISYQDKSQLETRLHRAEQAFNADQASLWRALQSQGVYRGSGVAAKVAFLYTGQGSQYANMLAQLRQREPIVADTFAEADDIMKSLLDRPLSSYLFVDPDDSAALKQADAELRRTEITQPAVLAVDTALTRLFASYGIAPDMVMGHSLGEYGALVAAGSLSFANALEAVSARGREMTRVSLDDNGLMAAVFAPLEQISEVVASIQGNVVIANINSNSQAVIGGASDAVERAMAQFRQLGVNVAQLPVSHAFHTSIVAPASEPLREVLSRMQLNPPAIPLVANVTGDFYPSGAGMLDMLSQQVASPVQFVKGLNTLYQAGARVLVEVGPKTALKGFADDVLGVHEDVMTLFTNHPKVGESASFNQALCGLYAAGVGVGEQAVQAAVARDSVSPPAAKAVTAPAPVTAQAGAVAGPRPPLGADRYQQLGQLFADFLEQGWQVYRGDDAGKSKPAPVITGAALGIPGTERIFDDSNVQRLLDGEQQIDVIPTRLRDSMVDKHITRLVKTEDGEPHFETIDSAADVIKLAGRGGEFDLEREFGVPADRIPALDITTRLAMAAGIDALRDAGIPLVMRYRTTHKGTKLPERWMLPESMRDNTGVIFAAAFPGIDSFADELTRYQVEHGRQSQHEALVSLREYLVAQNTENSVVRSEVERRIHEVEQQLEQQPYNFDRRFLFKCLAMGHSQMAEYIGARGPNTHINSACASTTQAFAVAEDWIAAGRCRRVLIIAADDVTSDHLLEWMGSGFLATGAAATDEVVADAALPFDLRRHGMILGMGACGIVIETPECAAQRGLRPICELLSTVTANSAFHGTRLDIEHICTVMEQVVRQAEQRFGLDRHQLASELMFVSHETYTPARGGSASAEVQALRRTFGDSADRIVIANTKGFTGHAMGVGIEDTIAIKALETGIVPPVANFEQQDPELGPLNLSKGGVHPIRYALRLGAGFGSQISLSLMRWVPSADGARPNADELGYNSRIECESDWLNWLRQASGSDTPELEVVQRTLRVKEGSVGQTAMVPESRPQPAMASVKSSSAAAPAAVAAAKESAPSIAVQANADPVAEQVLAVVAGITGYASDMLEMDLDLEADLGIDTVKQAETFAAIRELYDIPRDENLKLRDYPTIAHAVQFVKERCPELAVSNTQDTTPDPSVKTQGPLAAADDGIASQVLAVVAGITGYPSDMLDLDLDLEADLGIDTVKQAETFAAIREHYDIPRDENLKLRDYPSIAHAIEFVRERRPDLATAVVSHLEPVVPAEPTAASSDDGVTAQVLAVVSQITGYPSDMLDLDLDLEADLGIDTVKQAETFAAIREHYDIPRDENLKLRDYPSIAHAIGFVRERRPDLAAAFAVPEVSESARGDAGDAESQDQAITAQVMAVVSDITGYPTDMLDLDLDLEADLGIDTVKQAETFAAIREHYDIPRDENLKLRDYPTIAHAVEFVKQRRPQLAESVQADSGAQQQATADEPARAPDEPGSSTALPRRIPIATLRPPIDLCKATGVDLGSDSRVLLMPDAGGVGKALATRLQKLGVEVLLADPELERSEFQAQLQQWLQQGPIHGVYWLPALDPDGELEDIDLGSWRQALETRVKLLYVTMRCLYQQIASRGTFLIAATRLGGKHGYDHAGAIAAMGGAVSGFTKSYSRERPDALVKVVDFAASRKTAALADTLLQETLADPGAVEIGLVDEQRWTVTVTEQAANADDNAIELNADTVFAITGAAGSIVSAITADLAAASGGIFYLLDMAPMPDAANADIRRVFDDRDNLKRDLFERLKAGGERATPAIVERQLAMLERLNSALAAIEAVQAAGGTAHYIQLDLTDSDAVAGAIDTIRTQHGRIDVLLHAAGIERSHSLPDKSPEEFELVFDVKCDGWFNLLHSIADMPLAATVVFSSIAGRFGNMGQTDYSAANDLLCKYTSAMRRTHPNTRAIAIDWTAWASIGMASRGSIPEMMALAGIDMLAPEAGIPVIRRELSEVYGRGEIVIADRLGVLMDERDASGGLDIQALAEHCQHPMLGHLVTMDPHRGLRVDTLLDPTEQPFLFDHQIEGTPVLPGVMALEAFAELAQLLFPELSLRSLEDIEFMAPLKFYRQQPQTLELRADFGMAGDDVLVHCVCASSRLLHGQHQAQVTTHFSATVRLGIEAVAALSGSLPEASSTAVVTAQDLYRIYFHGAAYQVLQQAWLAGDKVVAAMADSLPRNHLPEDSPLVLPPRMIELCFQAAGAWQIGTNGKMALPRRIARITLPQAEAVDRAGKVHAIVSPRGEDTFDAEVIDDLGQVLLRLEGYQSIEYPSPIEETLRLPLYTAMTSEGDILS